MSHCAARPISQTPARDTKSNTSLRGWLALLIKIIQGAQHAFPLDPGRSARPPAVACRTSAKTFYYINNNAFHARKILFEIKSCFLHRVLFGVRCSSRAWVLELAARVTFSARNCTRWAWKMICELLTRHGGAHSGYLKRATPRCVRAGIWKFNKYAKPRRETEKPTRGTTWNALRTDFHYKLLWQKSLQTKLNGNCSWCAWAKLRKHDAFSFLLSLFVNHFSLSLLLYSHNSALKEVKFVLYQGEHSL